MHLPNVPFSKSNLSLNPVYYHPHTLGALPGGKNLLSSKIRLKNEAGKNDLHNISSGVKQGNV